jgi:two-component system cell cycle response regulator DivK
VPFSAVRQRNRSAVILIVDDSEDIREMFKFVLDSRGYSTIEAANGQEAVEVACTRRPDLILMDLSMPVLDGFGAVRNIRLFASLSKVPIIAVSAHKSEDHRTKALAIGFDEYLVKPVRFNLLERVIQGFLQKAA